MIIGGGSRRGAKWFAGHLMRNDEGQLVRLAEVRGLAGYDIPTWFRQMEAVSFGTRCDNYFYHASISPREDEHLTETQWEQAVDTLEHNLGLDGHSRFVVEHEKHGRTHRHVFWSRIDPDTMTAVSDSKTYSIHMQTADALEKAFGHEPTPRGRGPDGPNPKNYEVFRGQESGIDPYDVKAVATALWRQADSGQAFAAALEDHGKLILAWGDRRDFVIIDQAGDDYSLGRYVGARAADVRARMKDVDREALPSVAEARAIARGRETQRKQPEQQPTGFISAAQTPPKKSGPSPFGELAEELVHAARKGMKGEQPALAAEAACAEAMPFEKLARNLAQGAKEAAPIAEELVLAAAIVEGEHAAKEIFQGREAPARSHERANTGAPEPAVLTPFERITRDIEHAIRQTRSDDELVTAGLDWVEERIGAMNSPPPLRPREGTPFHRITEDTKQALRENGGQPYTGEETSFWQRARTALSATHERLASWAKESWQGFVERFKRGREDARDDQGFER